MATRSRIYELSQLINDKTKDIDNHLASSNLPTPSFDLHAPPAIPLPPALAKSRDEILDAIEELQALIAGPLPAFVRMMSPSINIIMSVQAIHRYRIASSFKLGEEVTFAEIGQRCGLSESDTRRFLRLAIANRIFSEPRKGVVAHSAISKLLVGLPLLNQWIGLVCDEMWPAAARAVDALSKWPGSEEPENTGFALANGVETRYFDVINQDPKRAQQFSDAMQFLQAAPPFDISHLIKSLNWDEETCPSLLVEVGGSDGSVSAKLLREYPKLRCIVQDLPGTMSTARVPEDLVGRLSFEEHNMFTEQDEKGANVYLLRSVLHNWPDKYAVQILQNLIPALRPGAKVILNEICLPEPGILSLYQEQFLRGYDLAMKQQFNGKERDIDDWTAIIRATSTKLKIQRIVKQAESMLSVIEVVWEKEDNA